MGIYNVHAGHNFNVPGAGGHFSETEQDRAVKDRVIGGLRNLGHTVYDCTDDAGGSQGANLANIVAKCNAHTVGLDISIHFNAFNGVANGVEVICFDAGAASVAQNVCNSIASIGFVNRGVKYRHDLYVLRNTKAPAILIECCFCDNLVDAGLYNADSMAAAIVKGITGQAVSGDPVQTPQPVPQPTPKPSSANVDVWYAVWTLNHGKLPEVKNRTDFAGVANDAIVGVKMRVSKGHIKYRIHAIGVGWMGWVDGYSWNDFNNGFAGDGKSVVDAIQIMYETPGDIRPFKYAVYQVKPHNGNAYYSNQRDCEKGKGMDGHAGAFGVPFTELLLSIE